MTFNQLTLLASICFLAMASPGPDFLLVTKNSVRYPRNQALATAFGIVAGCLVHATYCTLGLALIITKSIIVFSLLKYCGAIYLMYIGYKSFFSKAVSPSVALESAQQHISLTEAFRDGFLCNVLNPKLAVFLLSLFTQFISFDATISQKIVVAAIFVAEALFYWPALVLLLQQKYIQSLFQKLQKPVDKICGVLLVALGIKVMVSSE